MDACNDEMFEYSSSKWTFVWPRNKDPLSSRHLATSPCLNTMATLTAHRKCSRSHLGRPLHNSQCVPPQTPSSRQQLKQTLNPFRLISRTTKVERTVKLFAKSTSCTCARNVG